MKIQHIKHKAIDFRKWDKAIEASICPLIYAYSWYLDNVADEQWDALVYGDYEAVFPMPWKKKYGLKYIYQPFFCQQLGLFAKPGFTIPQSEFLKAIPRSFVLVDMQLNLYGGENPGGVLKKNYQLNLNHPYDVLNKNFNSDVKKNLRKIGEKDIAYVWDIAYEKVIEINREAWGDLNQGLEERHYGQLKANCEAAKEKDQLITIGAKLGDEIIGAALFFKTPKFLFYVNGGPTLEGKKHGIMNGIIDAVIKRFAGTSLILDFEGSEIAGVAYFYSKFGSEIKPYVHFRKYNIF